MKGVIYCFHCIPTGKKYIGLTEKTLEYRVKQHLHNVKQNYKTSRKFYNSIKKYGIDNFIIGIIEECDVFLLYEREKFYIKKYNTYKNGLNSTLGGEGASGWKHTEETRKKLGNINRGRKLTEEHKEKLRKHRHTEEWKRQQSERLRGRVVKPETRIKLSESQKGKKRRPISEEQREKQRQKMIGKPKSKEHSENIKKCKQGIRWWTNGIENKMSKQCPGDDWKIGKTSNPLPGRRGAIWWNNGVKNKCCKEYPGNGWVRGKIKKT